MSKILIVGQWFVSEDGGKIIIPGGTERYVYGLAKQLQSDGYEVMVLSATANKDEVGFNTLDELNLYAFKVTEKLYGYSVDILSFINTLKSNVGRVKKRPYGLPLLIKPLVQISRKRLSFGLSRCRRWTI